MNSKCFLKMMFSAISRYQNFEKPFSRNFLRSILKKFDFFWNFLKSKKSKKVGFQLKIFEKSRFRKFSIFENFQLKSNFSEIFRFQKFSDKNQTFLNRSQKFSAEPFFKILVPGNSWEHHLQETFRVHLMII